MHITPRIEKVLNKSEGILICWGHWLSDGWVERKMLLNKSGDLRGFAKQIKGSRIFSKSTFLESVYLCREMLIVTNFH